jgi:hypothetical protein
MSRILFGRSAAWFIHTDINISDPIWPTFGTTRCGHSATGDLSTLQSLQSSLTVQTCRPRKFLRWETRNCREDSRSYGQQANQPTQTHCRSILLLRTQRQTDRTNSLPQRQPVCPIRFITGSHGHTCSNQKHTGQSAQSSDPQLAEPPHHTGRSSSIQHTSLSADGLHNAISDWLYFH